MDLEASTLDELLDEWEERRGRGEAVTAAELCRRAPQLAAELTRQTKLPEALAPRPGPPAGEGPPPPALPARLAGYEILGELGRGGMGIVYRARDPVLAREVAPQVLRPAGPTDLDRLARRFRREARVLARLRHEHIIPVYEA